MATLLELKQALKSLYIKYEFYIGLAWKFVLTLIALGLINGKLGFQAALTSPFIVLMCSLLAAILPPVFVMLISALFILVHLAELSMEVAGLGMVLFLVMFLLYYRLAPEDTVAIVLTPITFCMGIPYVMPLALGLFGTPVSAISVSFGVVIHYYLKYVSDNAAVFKEAAGQESDGAADAAMTRLSSILDGSLGNKAMISFVIIFVIVVVLVYILRRLAIRHSWDVAILAGSLTMMIGLLVTNLMNEAGISVVGIILGSIVAAAIMKAIEFFAFNLDYDRTENVQFEDDEYYYFVKAVPKVSVAAPDRRVKQINRARQTEETHDVRERASERMQRSTPRPSARPTGNGQMRPGAGRGPATSSARRRPAGSQSRNTTTSQRDN